MVIDFIKKRLGIDEIIRRLDTIEPKVAEIEAQMKQMERTLGHFGDYKRRTQEELKLMKDQMEDLLGAVENLIENAETQHKIQEAKALRRRLRNNHTRIKNALAG